MDLKDKVALVTGGAQGIGRSIAEGFAREGAHLAIADIRLESAEKTAAEIAAAFKVQTIALKMDVTQYADVEAGVKAIQEKFGHLDVLVNNAGITRDGLLMRMKEEDWQAVISTNLTGVFLCTKAVLPVMLKQRLGRIVNIASVVGIMGNPGQANYSAAKAGVIGLTKTTAREVASRNINVYAIAPGFIDTAMTQKLPEDVKKALFEQIPLGRFGSPEDIAKVAVFLCRDGDYMTGQIISVDGGMVM